MIARTHGSICLGPSSNFQGGYNFLYLTTGRKITRKHFKEFPVPASVIKKVEALAARDKRSGIIVFSDRNGNPMEDGNLEDDGDSEEEDRDTAGVYYGDSADDDDLYNAPVILLESADAPADPGEADPGDHIPGAPMFEAEDPRSGRDLDSRSGRGSTTQRWRDPWSGCGPTAL
jgi:hypothetical protein